MGYMSIRSGPLDDLPLFMCCFVVLVCKSGKKKGNDDYEFSTNSESEESLFSFVYLCFVSVIIS